MKLFFRLAGISLCCLLAACQISANTPTATLLPAQTNSHPATLTPTFIPSALPASPSQTDTSTPVTSFASILDGCSAEQLIYGDDHSLTWTNEANMYIYLFAGDYQDASLVQYSSSQDCHTIALEYRENTGMYRLELFSIDSETRITTLAAIPNNQATFSMSISPNGKWLACILPSLSSMSQVFVYQLDTFEKTEVGSYDGESNPNTVANLDLLSWSPDSTTLAWADKRGVWLSREGGLASPNTIDANVQREAEAPYALTSWSPSSRFLLLAVKFPFMQQPGILDTITNKLTRIDVAFNRGYLEPNFTWLENEQIRVETYLPSKQVWQIRADGEGTEVMLTETPEPLSSIQLKFDAEKVYRWNESAQEGEILAYAPEGGSIVLVSASADQNIIAIGTHFEVAQICLLELLNVSSGIRSVIYEGPSTSSYYDVPRFAFGLISASVSPDGRWLAYMPRGTYPQQSNSSNNPSIKTYSTGFLSGMLLEDIQNILFFDAWQSLQNVLEPGGGGNDANWGVIYRVQTDKPASVAEIGFCGDSENPLNPYGCASPILWSLDSSKIAWSNMYGIWSLSSGGTATQIFSGPVDLIDWSPNGRYFQVYDNSYGSRGRIAILDTQSKTLSPLPEYLLLQYKNNDMPAHLVGNPFVQWQEENMLTIIQYVPITQTWQIEPESKDFLVIEE